MIPSGLYRPCRFLRRRGLWCKVCPAILPHVPESRCSGRIELWVEPADLGAQLVLRFPTLQGELEQSDLASARRADIRDATHEG